ncbi:acyl-CoA dehydrogenase family protein [Streptomyces sp. DSM 40712]|uniref:Acyl-CoA dehydrogenase family protein n=1 Tax=Streptomyces lancefieldiae TaxID=3075520 RepID=A0ABU3ALV1_9ACTN|nr:acyl-CoA dehydrogenase family protein [Streptomyces sp. DSM 40712]MDT0610830.1 acyl-CoA dehydrogenase family protein [Streptomyces sp. DSM 40712]
MLSELVADRAEAWDLAGVLPEELLRDLGSRGLLCAQVPQTYGGLGLDSAANGELTAHTGALCSSLRSVQTSQGMAAWTVSRLGDAAQRRDHLGALTSGELAAVAFSEPEAGSDLSAMTTRIRRDGEDLVVDGTKKWITAARYADRLVVFGRFEDAADGDDDAREETAAVVVVPRTAPGVRVDVIPDPLGCRAAGHAHVTLDSVRLGPDALLGGGAYSLPMLVTTALTYGRLSVAWGCVGILRACLRAAADHASSRKQFGQPLAAHQLVAGHLADLLVAERNATRACEHASRLWDTRQPDLATAAVLAKHVGATGAAAGSSLAVQILASAGTVDGHVVARAHRDAKLMEIIEGSNEISRLLLAEHALAMTR